MELKKATRKQVKMRLGISAVSGGGKTYSALLLAKGLVGDWDKIAIIDTENESASLYAHLGDYSTLTLAAPFTPERYIEAIKHCENAGIECVIIDSITHEWDGKGGILEIHSSMTGNSFTNWASITPRHNKFIEAILQSKCHIITTVRRKTEYDMSKDGNGKTKVEKAGLKEVTREGFEYELTVNFTLDEKHNCTASKDRTGLFMDMPFFTINEGTGEAIKRWCESGIVDTKEASALPAFFKTAAEKQQEAYNLLLTSQDEKQLRSNWKIIGSEIQAIPHILDLKERLKTELSKPLPS